MPTTAHLDAAPFLLTLSAHCESSLQRLAAGYAERIRAYPNYISDICRRSRAGKQHERRLAMIVRSTEEAVKGLEGFARLGKLSQGMGWTSVAGEMPVIGYLYIGQGSQYRGMAKEFYARQPVFRRSLNNCDTLLEPILNASLVDIIFNGDEAVIKNSRYNLPALFAVEYAVTILLGSYGIRPDLVIGYGVGEFIAACVAGVFSLEEGLRLIAKYGECLCSQQNTILMTEVSLGGEALKSFLDANALKVDIAAINAEDSTVISGSLAEMEKAVSMLAAQGIETKSLEVSTAFHSQVMLPVTAALQNDVRKTTLSVPKIPMLSNITGLPLGHELTTHQYWLEQITKPVSLSEGVTSMTMSGSNIYRETGPYPELTELARQTVNDDVRWLHPLHSSESDFSNLLEILRELFIMGKNIDFRPLDG